MTVEHHKSYYERHIFFCLNERNNGEACCATHNAQAAFDRCKIAGQGGRPGRAGRRCG